MEVSSFVRPADREKDVKDRFKEMKMRNEKLKAETYANTSSLHHQTRPD